MRIVYKLIMEALNYGGASYNALFEYEVLTIICSKSEWKKSPLRIDIFSDSDVHLGFFSFLSGEENETFVVTYLVQALKSYLKKHSEATRSWQVAVYAMQQTTQRVVGVKICPETWGCVVQIIVVMEV